MNNLGGHDLPSIVEAFDKIDHDRPTCFIAYTVKGFGLPIAGHKDNHAGLMTPAQMETFRQAMNIRTGHEWDLFEGLRAKPEQVKAFLDKVPFAQGGARRLKSPQLAVPAELAVTIQPEMSTQFGFGALLNELAREKTRAGLAHRHHLARRHRLDQSRTVGQSPRPVRAREHGRHVQERAHPLDLQLGVLAEGTAHRARHRRDEPVHPALRAWPVAFDQRRTAAADRHALRPVHRARPRCAELRLLPGRPLHRGGNAIGADACARGRRASVDRAAADRNGPGRPRRVRAGLCRRAGCDPRVLARLHPEGRRRRGLRTQLAARRDRRLGLSAAVDAAGRADQAHDDARAAPSHRRRRLLAARARPELPGRRRLHRRDRARGDPGGRPDGGGPPRRRPARRDVGGPAQRRLDRGAARARARARSCPLAHRAAVRRPARPIAASSRCSTAIRRRSAWLGAVYGHRVRPLGVEHFGQTGSLPDLYRHYGIDANAIVAAAQAIAPGRPIRHLRALG